MRDGDEYIQSVFAAADRTAVELIHVVSMTPASVEEMEGLLDDVLASEHLRIVLLSLANIAAGALIAEARRNGELLGEVLMRRVGFGAGSGQRPGESGLC